MRRLTLAVVSGLMLLSGIAFSQEPGYAYQKPQLEICISGGDENSRFQLQDKLDGFLFNKYTIRFVTTPPSTRGAIITNLLVEEKKNPESALPAECTIKATVTIVGASKLIERPIKGHDSEKEAGFAYNGAMQEIAGEIADAVMLSFPLDANIRTREKDLVYIDRSIQTGFAPGVYCDVYDGSEHVGVVRIVQADETQSIAKIVRGKNKIDVGNSVRTRHFVERFGFAFESFYAPATSSMGAVYKQVTGDSTSGDELQSAYVATASLIADLSPGGFQVGLGGGVMHLGDFNFYLLQAYASPAISVIYDRLSLSTWLGGGFFMVKGQPYARPTGSYTDGLPDRGNSDFNAQWYFRVEPGVRFYFTRTASISLFAGYFYSGKGDDWSKRVGKDKNTESKDLESTWVRYDHIQVSGFSYGITLSFSGTVW